MFQLTLIANFKTIQKIKQILALNWEIISFTSYNDTPKILLPPDATKDQIKTLVTSLADNKIECKLIC